MNNFSEKSLKRMSHRAKFNESIKLWDLNFILAADESYNEILYDLWDMLELNDKRNNYRPPKTIYKPEASLLQKDWQRIRCCNSFSSPPFLRRQLKQRFI